MTETGSDEAGIMNALKEGVNFLAMVRCIPWARPLFSIFTPNLSNEAIKLSNFARTQAVTRMKQGGTASEATDVFAHLLAEDSEESSKLSPAELARESLLVIIAYALSLLANT